MESMVEDFLETETVLAAKQALNQAQQVREAKIQAFQRRSNLRRMAKVFNQWQKFAQKQRIQTEILNNFPSAPSDLKVRLTQ